MNKFLTSIKDGTKDLIFGECELKEQIEKDLSALFEKWGYAKIITPTFEYADVFGLKSEDLYKFTDEKNHLLSLRADCTMPIARVAASKLSDETLPYRLYYNQNVFNNSRKNLEQTECGLELIGASGIKADIEILTLASCAMKLFFSDYHIEIGHGRIFKELVDEYKIDEKTAETVRLLIEKKNFAAIESLNIPSIIKALPKMFGKASVLDEFDKLTNNKKIRNILNYLKNIYNILSSLGLSVSFDLGLVHRLEYYTGIVFGGYVDGYGSSIMSGGRYDNLITKYGKDLKATGFGVRIDEIFEILKPEKPIVKNPDILLWFDENNFKNGYDDFEQLTLQGKNVIISTSESLEDAKAEAKARNTTLKTV